jgi:hypothetical protein
MTSLKDFLGLAIQGPSSDIAKKASPKASRFICQQGYLYLSGGTSLVVAPQLVCQAFLDDISDEQADVLRVAGVGLWVAGYLYVQIGRANSSFLVSAPCLHRLFVVPILAFGIAACQHSPFNMCIGLGMLEPFLALCTYVVWKGEHEEGKEDPPKTE